MRWVLWRSKWCWGLGTAALRKSWVTCDLQDDLELTRKHGKGQICFPGGESTVKTMGEWAWRRWWIQPHSQMPCWVVANVTELKGQREVSPWDHHGYFYQQLPLSCPHHTTSCAPSYGTSSNHTESLELKVLPGVDCYPKPPFLRALNISTAQGSVGRRTSGSGVWHPACCATVERIFLLLVFQFSAHQTSKSGLWGWWNYQTST